MHSTNKILIIDDDPGFRSLLSQVLQLGGWQVWEADGGDRGIALAREYHPEVVLCDLLMPGCNGFQVCRVLREDPSLAGTKIIVTTGRDYESDRHAAQEAGADLYLTKPLKPRNLLELLARLTGHSSPSEVSVSSPPVVPDGTLVRFWGVRGSVPTPGPTTVYYGGNTSCVEVRTGRQIIILDAGTGLRPLGCELSTEFNQQPIQLSLLLTHTHWDHIQGLPFFLPVYQPQNRLHILGYEGARHSLSQVLSIQMDSPYFPVELQEVPANIQIQELKELEFKVGDIPVKARYANHPGICVGYRLFTPHGSIAYFPDNEPYLGRLLASNGGAAGGETALAYARSEDLKMTEFLKDTDLLIMDSQYDCSEYRQHVGWGHGCLDEVVSLALRARVKRLFLFHHDPSHDDAKIRHMTGLARQLAADQKGVLHIEAAREGDSVLLHSNGQAGPPTA